MGQLKLGDINGNTALLYMHRRTDNLLGHLPTRRVDNPHTDVQSVCRIAVPVQFDTNTNRRPFGSYNWSRHVYAMPGNPNAIMDKKPHVAIDAASRIPTRTKPRTSVSSHGNDVLSLVQRIRDIDFKPEIARISCRNMPTIDPNVAIEHNAAKVQRDDLAAP